MRKAHPGWGPLLADQTHQPYFQALQAKLDAADQAGTVYPPKADRLRAYDLDPAAVRVVILGQDPYHGPGQAMGLSFSVPAGIRPPPSLVNIFKEIEAEGGAPAAGRSGDLTPWTTQGVLLLNATLTVAAKMPASHQGWGWETFTDATIKALSQHGRPRAFLLWGKFARSKAPLIDAARNLVLQSPHPSPYAAHTGFFGNDHFRKVNAWLIARGEPPIVW